MRPLPWCPLRLKVHLSVSSSPPSLLSHRPSHHLGTDGAGVVHIHLRLLVQRELSLSFSESQTLNHSQCLVKHWSKKMRKEPWFRGSNVRFLFVLAWRLWNRFNLRKQLFQIINCALVCISNAVIFVFSSLVPDVVYVEGFVNASNDKISPEGTSTRNQ